MCILTLWHMPVKKSSFFQVSIMLEIIKSYSSFREKRKFPIQAPVKAPQQGATT